MCGIAGVLSLDRTRPVEASRIERMAAALVHRGPDGSGTWVEGPIGLGHRRLAIIDPVGGVQPMGAADDRVRIVYNGEIYNYVELAAELRDLGHTFETTSDTEVLLAAYRQWGIGCTSRLNGMWAFALWDADARRLVCSRDRLGEKPLYYAATPHEVAFASEAKALFAGGVPRRPDASTLDLYLALTYVPAPHSFFEGVSKLPPGCSLVVERGALRIEPYWSFEIPPDRERRTDEPRILEEFEALFDDAVRLRMRSDVPFGAFLSGGLDSSSVVASMTRFAGEPVRTFTMGTGDARTDERDLARLVAGAFGTRHAERIVSPGDANALVSSIARAYDEPFGDSSALPTYLVSRLAAAEVKMVLTGDGGDEVLSGYTIHQGERFSQRFGRLPRLVRAGVGAGLAAMGRAVPAAARARRVVAAAGLDFPARLESKLDGLPARERARLLSRDLPVRPVRDFVAEALRGVRGRDSFVQLEHWLTRVSLPDDMLCKVDRASMAHSLETRVPFLDHRVVEFLASVAPGVKIARLERKRVLRRSIGRRLPAPLLAAAKRGFGVPLETWFASGGVAALEERARRLGATGWFDPAGLSAVLAAASGRTRWILALLAAALEP